MEKVHIGKLIREEMKKERRSATWLAEQLHCDRSNVYRICRKSTVDTDLLFHISHALHFDFFRYYSASLRLDEE
jgi:plasmid maintenance system antidote protein VapI